MGKGDTEYDSIISYNCMWIYNYSKIKFNYKDHVWEMGLGAEHSKVLSTTLRKNKNVIKMVAQFYTC